MFIIIGGLLIFLTCKCFTYYCATCGLMYYLETYHKDEIEEDKLKEITYQSTKRMIYDFFNKNQN